MDILFESPIRSKQVSKDVTAYQYANGMIRIEGISYLCYSMTEAIKKHRANKKMSFWDGSKNVKLKTKTT